MLVLPSSLSLNFKVDPSVPFVSPNTGPEMGWEAGKVGRRWALTWVNGVNGRTGGRGHMGKGTVLFLEPEQTASV